MPLMPSFITGGVPSASNLNALATGVDVLSRITIGKAASLGPSARPTLKLVRLNTLSIPNDTLTFIPWEAATVNSDEMWFNPSGPTVTITTAGWYRIAGAVSYDPGAAAFRSCKIFVNGTADPTNCVADSNIIMGSPSPNSCRIQAQAYEHLAAGATVQLATNHQAGTAVVLDPQSKWGTWLVVRWDAPY